MGKKGRRTGLDWERDVVSWFSTNFGLEKFSRGNEATAQVASSRMMSKALDNQKVDIWFDAPFFEKLKIQCKKCLSRSKSSKNVDITSLYEMVTKEGDYPLLFTRVKIPKGTKQEQVFAEVVTMDIKTFKRFLDVQRQSST